MSDRKKCVLALSAVLSFAIPILICIIKMSLFLSLSLFCLGIFGAVLALKIALPVIKQDKKNGRESPTVLFFAIMAEASFGADIMAAAVLFISVMISKSPF